MFRLPAEEKDDYGWFLSGAKYGMRWFLPLWKINVGPAFIRLRLHLRYAHAARDPETSKFHVDAVLASCDNIHRVGRFTTALAKACAFGSFTFLFGAIVLAELLMLQRIDEKDQARIHQRVVTVMEEHLCAVNITSVSRRSIAVLHTLLEAAEVQRRSKISKSSQGQADLALSRVLETLDRASTPEKPIVDGSSTSSPLKRKRMD